MAPLRWVVDVVALPGGGYDEASDAARIVADIIGGDAQGSVNEALLDVPVTAHILGGCVIGQDREHGVIDGYQRVFGHPGLHVVDGSAVSANLGVNPSLTITATSAGRRGSCGS